MGMYHFQGEETIPSPALIYYKDIIIKNTETAVTEAGGAERLWPHVKSHKMTEVIKLQVQMGITKFKCATVIEAEAAAKAGGKQILLAYPLVGPNQDRFLDLIKSWPDRTFYALGDDLDQVKELALKAKKQNMTVKLCVDVNTGMNRTGVDFQHLKEFCKELSCIEGVKVSGFHCYDGNRHEKEISERTQKVSETINRIHQVMKCLEKEMGQEAKELFMIMGGSPTFPCYAEEMKEDHVFYSPGTVFIYDVGYQKQFPDLPYEPGAAILCRVVSHPAPGYFTIDCGYKAVSAEQTYPGILTDVPYGKSAFQSEEHWTFCMEQGHENQHPAIGQVLYVMPWHICPTTAMYEEAVVVNDGKIDGVWQVSARNRNVII